VLGVLGLAVAAQGELVALRGARDLVEGGNETAAEDFEYSASVQREVNNSFVHECTGALIAPDYVLLTKNCVTEADRVVFGEPETDLEVIRPVKEKKVVGEFALLVLENLVQELEPVTYTNISIEESQAADFEIVGYVNSALEPLVNTSRRFIQASVFNESTCSSVGLGSVEGSQFCAGFIVNETESELCTGETPGSVVLDSNGTMVGLVSAHIGCGSSDGFYVAIVSRVSSDFAEIEAIIAPSVEEDEGPTPLGDNVLDFLSSATGAAILVVASMAILGVAVVARRRNNRNRFSTMREIPLKPNSKKRPSSTSSYLGDRPEDARASTSSLSLKSVEATSTKKGASSRAQVKTDNTATSKSAPTATALEAFLAKDDDNNSDQEKAPLAKPSPRPEQSRRHKSGRQSRHKSRHRAGHRSRSKSQSEARLRSKTRSRSKSQSDAPSRSKMSSKSRSRSKSQSDAHPRSKSRSRSSPRSHSKGYRSKSMTQRRRHKNGLSENTAPHQEKKANSFWASFQNANMEDDLNDENSSVGTFEREATKKVSSGGATSRRAQRSKGDATKTRTKGAREDRSKPRGRSPSRNDDQTTRRRSHSRGKRKGGHRSHAEKLQPHQTTLKSDNLKSGAKKQGPAATSTVKRSGAAHEVEPRRRQENETVADKPSDYNFSSHTLGTVRGSTTLRRPTSTSLHPATEELLRANSISRHSSALLSGLNPDLVDKLMRAESVRYI